MEQPPVPPPTSRLPGDLAALLSEAVGLSPARHARIGADKIWVLQIIVNQHHQKKA